MQALNTIDLVCALDMPLSLNAADVLGGPIGLKRQHRPCTADPPVAPWRFGVNAREEYRH